MIKLGYPVFVVESVENAVKFYSDKLGFDVVELANASGSRVLTYAELKKGKAVVAFRTPMPEEAVEFSQIKYCMSRGAGFYSVMKKGLDKYYARCRKKGVEVLTPPANMPWGHKVFMVKDPFGFKLGFGEPIAGFRASFADFCGFKVDKSQSEGELVEDMVHHLRTFGLSRRCSKKYAKLFLRGAKKS